MIKRKIFSTILLVATMISVVSMNVEAGEADPYYKDDVIYTGYDKGYKSDKGIDSKNPHYGWKMGQFVVEGHSGYVKDSDGNPIFLKNPGDEVSVGFELFQNINKLDGNKKYYVCSDTNGYIDEYSIKKTDMGKGYLIVEYTNSQNETEDIEKHKNYLSATASKDAITNIKLCEEGDYKITLLYEIEVNNWGPINAWKNYRMDFEFSVRNSDAMVFPMDIETQEQLIEQSYSENGFYLDFNGSEYLIVNVKKETVEQGANGLVQDEKYNRTFSDGAEFTEEGIYTIVVRNEYTDAVTEKVVYVGDSNIIRAISSTGMTVEEIQGQMNNGAVIDEFGNIVFPQEEQEIVEMSYITEIKPLDFSNIEKADENTETVNVKMVVLCTVIIAIVIITVVIGVKMKMNKLAEREEIS